MAATMAEVTGLTPFTDYTFSVTSENAVSSQASDTSSRTSTASATTLEGGGFACHEVQHVCQIHVHIMSHI